MEQMLQQDCSPGAYNATEDFKRLSRDFSKQSSPLFLLPIYEKKDNLF